MAIPSVPGNVRTGGDDATPPFADVLPLLLALVPPFALAGLLVDTLEWMLGIAVVLTVAALAAGIAVARGRVR